MEILKRCIVFSLLIILISCGESNENGNSLGERAVSLKLSQYATGSFNFYDFDNPLGANVNTLSSYPVSITGATFYRGTFSAYDGAKVNVFVVLVPSASIDRILIQVNGGTGTDARHGLNNYNHKASVMVSMRGLHPDDIMEAECALGGGLIDCLKQVPYLKKVNPKDNGRDVVDVMRIILGDTGNLTVDGLVEDHSFFGVGDDKFNMETGSYGATILGYALARANLPDVGRIFIEGPSSPGEFVISDGFRNTQVSLDNLMDSLGMVSTEKQNFLDVMKARHSSYNTTCDPTLNTAATVDCLSTAMIFEYVQSGYENISSNANTQTSTQINTAITSLRNAMIALPSTDATSTSNMSAVLTMYNSTEVNRNRTTWDMAKLDLLSSTGIFNGIQSPGFTSRFGQICSAYINRENGDSLALFNTEKNDSTNDPYWYGFLIEYRDMYTICSQIASNLTTEIVIPDANELDIDVEALVQYGAGIDEKHHQSDINEMASYVNSSSVIKNVYRSDQIQGGSGPRYYDCFSRLREATFETTTTNLTTQLNSVITTYCDLTP